MKRIEVQCPACGRWYEVTLPASQLSEDGKLCAPILGTRCPKCESVVNITAETPIQLPLV